MCTCSRWAISLLALMTLLFFVGRSSGQSPAPPRLGSLSSGANLGGTATAPSLPTSTGSLNQGIGQIVSGWTHQGIVGRDLAERIHELKRQMQQAHWDAVHQRHQGSQGADSGRTGSQTADRDRDRDRDRDGDSAHPASKVGKQKAHKEKDVDDGAAKSKAQHGQGPPQFQGNGHGRGGPPAFGGQGKGGFGGRGKGGKR